MKRIGIKIKIFILYFLLVGCANKEEVQKYASLKQENAKLIKQTNSVITFQKVKADSINNVIKAYLDVNLITDALIKKYSEVDDVIEAQGDLEMLNIELGTVDLCCSILEKANKRFGYLFKNKRSIKRMWTKRLSDTNSEINNMTGGLSAKDYIYKYLPESLK